MEKRIRYITCPEIDQGIVEELLLYELGHQGRRDGLDVPPSLFAYDIGDIERAAARLLDYINHGYSGKDIIYQGLYGELSAHLTVVKTNPNLPKKYEFYLIYNHDPVQLEPAPYLVLKMDADEDL